MSPYWRREDNEALIEARRLQVELAAAAQTLTLVATRLSVLVAELNAEAEGDAEGDERGR